MEPPLPETQEGEGDSKRKETIALFGITGRTGKHFARLAIKGDEYRIRALARNPAKVENTCNKSESVTIVEGNIQDEDPVYEVLKGADYVVCMIAASTTPGSPYPENFMLHFVQRVHRIIEENHDVSPKVLLYQAGSMSTDEHGYLHPVAWTMKQTLGRRLGILPKIADNDAAIQFLARQNIAFIVPRAGVLTEEANFVSHSTTDRRSDVVASGWPPLPIYPVSFGELAQFAIDAIQDESMYNSCPFVRRK